MAEETKTHVVDDSAAPRRAICQPPVDIFEDANGLTLRADLPGVSKDSLELLIEDNVLKIFGRTHATVPGDAIIVHQELRMGDYYRSFILGDEIDSDKIKAELDNGVLVLYLPKRPTRPRRIELETG